MVEPLDPEGTAVVLMADMLARLNASTVNGVEVSSPSVKVLLGESDERLLTVVADLAPSVVSTLPAAFVVLAVGIVMTADVLFSSNLLLPILLLTSLA